MTRDETCISNEDSYALEIKVGLLREFCQKLDKPRVKEK